MNSEQIRKSFTTKAPVVATTPHGSYTFDVTAVEFDAVERRFVLCLQEVAHVDRPCTECDRPRAEFPAIFLNDGQCSVACQKVAGL